MKKRGYADIAIYTINRCISGEGMVDTGVGEMFKMLLDAFISHKDKGHIEIKWIDG